MAVKRRPFLFGKNGQNKTPLEDSRGVLLKKEHYQTSVARQSQRSAPGMEL